MWRPANKLALRVYLALGVDARIKSGHDQLCSSLPGPDPAIHPWSPRGGRPAPARRTDKASGGSYLRDTTLDSFVLRRVNFGFDGLFRRFPHPERLRAGRNARADWRQSERLR